MPGSDLAWWLAATTLILIGAACAGTWARGDRARGRTRCPRCWYDMAGAPSLACPECGHAAARPADLLRSRRKPRWALAAGLALLAGLGVALVPDLRAGGSRLWNRVPTTLLLAAEHLLGHNTWRDLTWHRGLRLTEPGLWDWQLRALALRRARDLELWRDVWPVGLDVGVRRSVVSESDFTLIKPEFFASPDPRVEPPAPPPGMSHEPLWHPAWAVVAQSAQAASLPASFQRFENGRVGATLRIDLPIRRVPTIDDAIAPVRDAALDAAIAGSLRPRLVHMANRGLWALAIHEPTFDAPDPVALGLVITIEHHGSIVGTARLTTSTTRAQGDMLPGAVVRGDDGALAAADPADPAWTVRVRGDGALALFVFDCRRYWAGEFTLPLSAVKK